MSPDVRTQPRYADICSRFEAGVGRLEEKTQKVSVQDTGRLTTARKNLQVTIATAAKVKEEYEALQLEFAATLDRICGLDLKVLRAFSGSNILGDLVECAKQIKGEIVQAISSLDRVPARVENLTVDATYNNLPRTITEDVQHLAGGPTRILDKIEGLLKRLDHFEAAQAL